MKNGIGAAVVALSLLLLVTVVAWPGKKGGRRIINTGRVLSVNIYDYTQACDVDYPKVTLSLKFKHSVWWQSMDGTSSYSVLFRPDDGTSGSGTPFTDAQGHPRYNFPVDPTNGSDKVSPTKTGYYEYSVNDGSNKECKKAQDPGVIVKD